MTRPAKSPRSVPRRWSRFLHLEDYVLSDSPDGVRRAAKRGEGIDLNNHVTADGVIANTHWADPLRHGWRWDDEAPDDCRRLPDRTKVSELTWQQVQHLVADRDGREYRVHKYSDMARLCADAGVRMEFEAKNSPGFLDPAIWTRVQHVAGDVGLDIQVKAESWVNVPGRAVAIFTAVKAGSSLTTIMLPRGTLRVPRSAWPVIDFVRGPVVWTGPTPADVG